MNNELITAMADLDEDILFDLIKKDVAAGVPSDQIIADLQSGMQIIGDRFAAKEYFVSELIMSGELFKEAQELLGDGLGDDSNTIGTFILGTVKDDIHDIGKNIVSSVLSSNGFKVIDLGVDVPKEKFVEAIRESDSKVIGLSCLLTTCFKGLKETVDEINAQGLHEGRLIIIGGGVVDEMAREYCGADKVGVTAQDTANLAKEFLGKN